MILRGEPQNICVSSLREKFFFVSFVPSWFNF